MYNHYPHNIANKADSAQRLQLLLGVDPSFYTTAAEFNKLLSAVDELYTLRPKVWIDVAGTDYAFDLYKAEVNNNPANQMTFERLDYIIGVGSNDKFIQAQFIGLAGEEDDLYNNAVYTHFGGTVDASIVPLKAERFISSDGQTEKQVAGLAITDNGLWSVQVGAELWNSRTGITSFADGLISIDFATGTITFHEPLELGTHVIIKYN